MSDLVGPINHLRTQSLTGAPVARRRLMVAIVLSDEEAKGWLQAFLEKRSPKAYHRAAEGE
jgi:hypothetical protein